MPFSILPSRKPNTTHTLFHFILILNLHFYFDGFCASTPNFVPSEKKWENIHKYAKIGLHINIGYRSARQCSFPLTISLHYLSSFSYSLTHSHTPDGSVWVQDARWRVEHLGIRHDSRSLFQIHRLLYVLILISTNVPSNVADPARPIQFSPTEAFQVLAGLCHTGEEEMKENTHTQDNGNCYRGIHYA